jgi:hypothetical protein
MEKHSGSGPVFATKLIYSAANSRFYPADRQQSGEL